MEKTLTRKIDITVLSAVLSLLNTLIFHIPFFRYVLMNVEKGINGVLITASLAVIMLAANYFAFYLILYLGRGAGRAIAATIFILNAVSLYFINTYDVMLDDTMMGNVFNTNYSEATSYYSTAALLYIILCGILPAATIFIFKVSYGTLKRFFANTGIPLAIITAIAFANMSNWMWMDKNSTVAGSLVLPWSYIVNTFRYHNSQREKNKGEILLPDAVFPDDSKEIVVLVIGESSRRDHFSLYGYNRETNPLMQRIDGITAYKANSSATYTTAGVKAILEHQESNKLYEILPNYLFRCGAEVIWRTSNWGQPPLHIEHYQDLEMLKSAYGTDIDTRYDSCLLTGLREMIENSSRNKVLAVLHTSSSHGPSYSEKYPPEFEVFTPVCKTVEVAKCPQDELINAYDNTIVYTDYLLDSVISLLKSLKEFRSCMIFVSDHGESLGEGNLYMHGVPIGIAPKEQYEIPFIVWTSDGSILKDIDSVTQHHVFHSTLGFLGAQSPVYVEELDIFNTLRQNDDQ